MATNINRQTLSLKNAAKAVTTATQLRVQVQELDSDTYLLRRPITINVEKLSRGEYVAQFDEAGLSMSGNTPAEAIKLLKSELVESLMLFRGEAKLGPDPKRQLAVLENYIGKKGRE